MTTTARPPTRRPKALAAVAGSLLLAVAGAGGLVTAPASAAPAVADPSPVAKIRGLTATVLADGRVLVAGNAPPALYDPRVGSWSPAGQLTPPRLNHTATRLNDGRVLVAGGFVGGATPSVQLFDPKTTTWADGPPLAHARYDHTATLLDDGTVLVAGGRAAGHGPFLSEAERYDPKANTWRPAGAMALGRAFHTATLLDGGKVLVTGGQGEAHAASLRDALTYDPATDQWTLEPQLLAVPRLLHTATRLSDGTVLVAGGTRQREGQQQKDLEASVEIYDPAARSFVRGPSMAVPRAGHSALPLGGGVLVIGGEDAAGASVPATAERYDPLARAWRSSPLPKAAVPVLAATMLGEGACARSCEALVLGAAGAARYAPDHSSGSSGGGRQLVVAGALVAVVVLAAGGATLVRKRRRRAGTGQPRASRPDAADAARRRDVAAVCDVPATAPVSPVKKRGGRAGRAGTAEPQMAPEAAAQANEVVGALEGVIEPLRSSLAALADLRRPRLLGKTEEDQRQVERAADALAAARRALDAGDVATCGAKVADAHRQLSTVGSRSSLALAAELRAQTVSAAQHAEMSASLDRRRNAEILAAEAESVSPREALLAWVAVGHAAAEGFALATGILSPPAGNGSATRRAPSATTTAPLGTADGRTTTKRSRS